MISVIALLVLCSTVTAGTGVWAAAQNLMQASNNISFVADPYVDAVFTDSVNTFIFESNKANDDNQQGSIKDIITADWELNLDTEADYDVVATLQFTITNTSDIESNILTYDLSNDFNYPYCVCNIDNSTGSLNYGESKDIVVTFVADGIHDVDVDINWTLTLTASK